MTDLAPFGWWLDYQPGSAVAFSGDPTPITPGLYYWEVTINAGGQTGDGYGILFGVANSSAILRDTVDAAVNSDQPNAVDAAFVVARVNASGAEDAAGWGYPVRMGGITAGCATATGQVYGCALNTLTKKFWVRNISRDIPSGQYAGGGGAGDPASGTQGCDLTGIPVTGPLFIFVGGSNDGTGDGSHYTGVAGKGTINFGASAFTGTPPTGFVSIESVFPGAKLNTNDNSNLVLTNGNLTWEASGQIIATQGFISGSQQLDSYNSARSIFSIAQS